MIFTLGVIARIVIHEPKIQKIKLQSLVELIFIMFFARVICNSFKLPLQTQRELGIPITRVEASVQESQSTRDCSYQRRPFCGLAGFHAIGICACPILSRRP